MDDCSRVAMVETKTVDTTGGAAPPVARTRYQLADHLESTLLEVDATGSVISYEEYHPYGSSAYRAATSDVEVSPKRYRYTGMERDDETGLAYHGARYYAPWLGRWTAADPSGMVDGPNLYLYARANPLRFRDPSGNEGESTNYRVGQMDDVALHRHVKGLSPEARWQLATSASGWAQRRVWGTIANGAFEVKKPPAPVAPAAPSADPPDFDPSPLPDAPADADNDEAAGPSQALTGVGPNMAVELLRQVAQKAGPAGALIEDAALVTKLGMGPASVAVGQLAAGPGYAPLPPPVMNFTQGDTGAETIVYKDMDGKKCDRPVIFNPPTTDLSLTAMDQTILYVQVANVELKLGLLSPTGRVPTLGPLRAAASAAARVERARADAAGTPYSGVVGHGIDTTWTGQAVPPVWLDQRPAVNGSLGGQSRRYPIGYKPQCFIYGPTGSTMTPGMP
jgi:RHS repeat-associated protein